MSQILPLLHPSSEGLSMKIRFVQSELGIWTWSASFKWERVVKICFQQPVGRASCLAISLPVGVSSSIPSKFGCDLVVVPTVWLPLVPACYFSLVLQPSCWFYELFDILPINSFSAKISQSVSVTWPRTSSLYGFAQSALCLLNK